MEDQSKSGIVFFDLETMRRGQTFAILEFGAILVCPRKLVELENYSTLIRPNDVALISLLSDRRNGITRAAVSSAPTFADIADEVYDILNGRIWAGHNILSFDWPRIWEAFAEIGRPCPEPKEIIDSLALLTERFGRRAGNMKMATLATYFGLGEQIHRSLADVRMNLKVLKNCATVLFLESSLLDVCDHMEEQPPMTSNGCSSFSGFLNPDEVSIPSINVTLVPFYRGSRRLQILHNDVLKLCTQLKVRFGISRKFVDQAGRPRLSFVVDAPPSLCEVLDACDDHAQGMFMESGSTSDWRPVVSRKNGFWNFPTVRLHIPTVITGDVATYGTEILQKEAASSAEQKLQFSNFDAAELDTLFTPGTLVDAFFSLDLYYYPQNAGIRLVAKKLVIHSK